MKRKASQLIENWAKNKIHKPLILRGARQTGKTTLIRQIKPLFENYVEINFEELPNLQSLFEKDLDVHRILSDLELALNVNIKPGETLLFFDEIQACPKALLALRYFYEKIPSLHVVAAGSLIEFAIEKIGVPVGRVSFLYIYPMSFIEFLWALNEDKLADAIQHQNPNQAFTEIIHQKALRLVGEYIAIGGMPEAVKTWRDKKNYASCVEVHHDLLNAYQQDFEKYARRAQIKYVELLFQQVPLSVGKVFRFSELPGNYRKRELSPALELLTKANVINKISQTSGNGLPLAANSKPESFKLITLDVALMQASLGITSQSWILETEKSFINKSAVAEAFIGQELLAYANPRQPENLFYWQRNKRGSEAELDYMLAINGLVIPIEVKAGKGSTLKSLNLFLNSHPASTYGIRFSTQNFSSQNRIHSYPLYAASSLFPTPPPDQHQAPSEPV